MDQQSVERQQTGLVQFLIIVIMLILGTIMWLSYQVEAGPLIPILALAALTACLYAAVQERRLRRLHRATEKTLDTKVKVMDRMGTRLREESARTQELGSRLDELTKLYRAISAVNAVSDPGATYDVVVRAAVQLVRADTGSLMLMQSNRRELAIRSAFGLPKAVLANHMTRKVGAGVSGWVAENAEPVLLTGAADEDERFVEAIPDSRTNVALSVPLMHAQQVIGVLNLGLSEDHATEEGERRSLGAADMSVTNIFAQHAAVTVLRARLLERQGAS